MSAKKKKAAGKVAKRVKPAKGRAKAPKAKPKAKAKARAPKKHAAPKKRVAAKAAPKKAAPKKAAPIAKAKRSPSPPALKRRDGSGHLDPKYAADLRARSRNKTKDDNRAFGGDALSEELGEEFVETVTSGEDEGNEVRDQRVTEELGGPFTVTTGGSEFGNDVDGSNPKGATREPFPRT
jgi:hypothetical protein